MRCCDQAAWSRALLLVAATLYSAPGFADGSLDPEFGTAGELLIKRVHSTHTASAELGGLAPLPDGRHYWAMSDGDAGIWLARMHHDGSWDAGFAGSGLVELSACAAHPARAVRVAADDDDGVVLWTGSCLLRFHADGSPDPDFAAGSTMPGSGFRASTLLRGVGGHWLLAGTAGNQQFAVWRFRSDGGNDPAFGDQGQAQPSLPAGNVRQLKAMLERPDGGLLLAGGIAAPHMHLVLLQLLPDGTPDHGFGDQGVVMVPPPDGFNSLVAKALTFDRDGSVIVAGNGGNGMQSCCVLVTRFDPSGVLDPNFGLRLLPAPLATTLSPFGETTHGLALLPGRQILLARTSFPFPSADVNSRTRFTLLRLHADGELDLGFGDGGWHTYVVSDPTGAGMTGAYTMLHGLHYAGASALLFGRTFFEDSNSDGRDFVTLARARFERLFDGDFEP